MTTRQGLPTLLARAMWAKLDEPRCIEKGDNWCALPFDTLWMLFMTDVDELRSALNTGTIEETKEEIADCANFLAMILDKLESPWCASST